MLASLKTENRSDLMILGQLLTLSWSPKPLAGWVGVRQELSESVSVPQPPGRLVIPALEERACGERSPQGQHLGGGCSGAHLATNADGSWASRGG